MQYRLNLKSWMDRIGKMFVAELRQAITKQTGLDGRRFFPIKPSTAWGRSSQLRQGAKARHLASGKSLSEFSKARRKHEVLKGKFIGYKKTSSGLKGAHEKRVTEYPAGIEKNRLLFTKDFVTNAFKFTPNENSVTVFVSGGNHSNPGTASQVTYEDIVRYNCKGSEDVNLNIAIPPQIFPNDGFTPKQMKSWKMLTDTMLPAISRDIARQVKSQMVRRNVSINL